MAAFATALLALALLSAAPALAQEAHPAEVAPAAASNGHGEGGAEGQHGGLHLDGSALSVIWVLPFIGMLLSIALFPLLAAHF
ncbi:MAG: sodium:proton antiporter, partial [Deltaproteobacteria bacterium]|nr:sodium:proton antiporter [Deltaproteobacteria bacterium]